MAADDIVDGQAMIFTEADVYMIAGYLAVIWHVEHDDVTDIESAITAILAHE